MNKKTMCVGSCKCTDCKELFNNLDKLKPSYNPFLEVVQFALGKIDTHKCYNLAEQSYTVPVDGVYVFHMDGKIQERFVKAGEVILGNVDFLIRKSDNEAREFLKRCNSDLSDDEIEKALSGQR